MRWWCTQALSQPSSSHCAVCWELPSLLQKGRKGNWNLLTQKTIVACPGGRSLLTSRLSKTKLYPSFLGLSVLFWLRRGQHKWHKIQECSSKCIAVDNVVWEIFARIFTHGFILLALGLLLGFTSVWDFLGILGGVRCVWSASALTRESLTLTLLLWGYFISSSYFSQLCLFSLELFCPITICDLMQEPSCNFFPLFQT